MSDTLVTLFGLNYIGTRLELKGCINDAALMRRCLNTYAGVPARNISTMTDRTRAKPTKRNMMSHLESQIRKLNADKRLKTLWVHYSGHGTRVRDKNGDERDGYDEALCPLSGGVILDDELNKLFAKIKRDKRLICVFDCCHSGTALDLPYQFDYMSKRNRRDSRTSKIACSAIMLSGCMDKQYSYDAKKLSSLYTYTGAFTTALLRGIQYSRRTSIEVRTVMRDAHLYLKKRRFNQRPCASCTKPLKSNGVLLQVKNVRNVRRQYGKLRQKASAMRRKLRRMRNKRVRRKYIRYIRKLYKQMKNLRIA